MIPHRSLIAILSGNLTGKLVGELVTIRGFGALSLQWSLHSCHYSGLFSGHTFTFPQNVCCQTSIIFKWDSSTESGMPYSEDVAEISSQQANLWM